MGFFNRIGNYDIRLAAAEWQLTISEVSQIQMGQPRPQLPVLLLKIMCFTSPRREAISAISVAAPLSLLHISTSPVLISGLRRQIQSSKASVPCADCGGLQVLPQRPARG